ncbi:LPXTG cell wall anchor domain-containing protein [Neobacillus massiliamazoniensis]|uniref:Gram positive anchor n=1 Tax=Neobacillus massiliamazoniensis TaxID=1499688 RepID=A0A0U1NXS4_9BACI|nr:LPXTG cell wall anchor domain-containing protein [Neobacillus massiliamazoniensis]CRK82829.1 Gram positive anchor [Neobacillus massiliamazoniensis]
MEKVKKKKIISAGLTLGLTLSLMIPAATPFQAAEEVKIKSVKFNGMEAPKTLDEMASVQSKASVNVTYSNGETKTFPLVYNKLFQTNDKIVTNKGQKIAAGTPIDVNGNPIMDHSVPTDVVPFISDSPDSNSLMRPMGNDNSLYLVTHYEYQTIDHTGKSAYGVVPASMTVSKLMQNTQTGELQLMDAVKADMSAGNGIWIPCNGSLTPWNTHLGSEEYEPDARKFESNPTSDPTNVKSFAKYYFGDEAKANPYFYGFIPEVTVSPTGTTKVVKHYSAGRKSNELMRFMDDKRTAYFGDDGSYTTMFMYIADKEADLSAGTLYAAKFAQTGTENGGSGNINWIKLGHATDDEVKNIIDKGGANGQPIKFSDIFDVSDKPQDGFTAVKQYSYGSIEYLKLKPGMEKAAAFLEPRRYAAMLGATSEFNKMEGIAANNKDKKLYMAITDVSKGMEANSNDPTDDIHLPKINSGVTFEFNLTNGLKDTNGNNINSNYVAANMHGLVVGKDLPTPDEYGNTADPNSVANTDNLSYSEELRTLFIGEDSSKHINNFVWAYNVDTKELTRILSVPAGAEATGLMVSEAINGYTYIMSNFQHPGDELDSFKPTKFAINDLKNAVDKYIGINKAGMVGYLTLGQPVQTSNNNDANTTPGNDNGNNNTTQGTNDNNDKGNALPNTATSNFNFILSGLALILAGVGAFFFRKRLSKSE